MAFADPIPYEFCVDLNFIDPADTKYEKFDPVEGQDVYRYAHKQDGTRIYVKYEAEE